MTGPDLTRRFAALSALRWLPVGLTVPVLVLLLQARGLDLATTGRLVATYSAVTLLLELPTGGLADVVGRRPVLVASSVASALGSALMAVGTSIAVLVTAIVLAAVGRALGSGPLEAWYVDTVRAEDPAADIRHGLAGGQTAEAAALGVGAVLGGLIPAWVATLRPGPQPLAGIGLPTVVPLAVPFLLSAVLFVVHAVAVVLLVRERSPGGRGPSGDGDDSSAGRRGVGASVAGTVRDGVRLAAGSGGIRRLLAYTVTFGITLSGLELLSPGHVAGLLGGPEAGGAAYGILVAAAFGASGLGAWLVPRLTRRAGSGSGDAARRWAVGLNLAAAATVCLVGVPLIGPVVVAYTLAYLLLGASGPLVAEMLHDRVSEQMRSTLLSLQSLTGQSGGLVASLLLGALADRTGVWPAFVAIGVALAAGALLLPRSTASSPPAPPSSP